MELFSGDFRSAVVQLFKEDEVTLLATIPIKKQHPIPFVEEIRQRNDVKLFEVNLRKINMKQTRHEGGGVSGLGVRFVLVLSSLCCLRII